ncbi:MAG: winged helix-turn-helix transcriptional regulator [Verrucomicrobiales bacterium]
MGSGRTEVGGSGARAGGVRRSPCPVACALDLLGDRWTLLVVRDLMLGRTRFKEFLGSPEGIPTNILAERLERLIAAGLVRKVPVPEGGKRLAYALTDKGVALKPVLRALKEWGHTWESGTSARLERA